MGEVESGKVLWALEPDTQVVSASTIKVPVLLAALEEVRQGRLALDQALDLPAEVLLEDSQVFEYGPTRRTLWELLYWMIVESDNTATNRVLSAVGYDAVNAYARDVLGLRHTVCQRKMLDWLYWMIVESDNTATNRVLSAVGYDAVNAYARDVLGLRHTVCQRKMLDWDAIAAGRNNYTSAADQFALYRKLCRGELLNESLTAVALDMLRRQRSMDDILRYIPYPVDFAHKTGGLDYLSHDAGVFFQPGGNWFLGIFTWDGPSPEGDKRQKMFIGRLAQAIYNTYGAPAPSFCSGG